MRVSSSTAPASSSTDRSCEVGSRASRSGCRTPEPASSRRPSERWPGSAPEPGEDPLRGAVEPPGESARDRRLGGHLAGTTEIDEPPRRGIDRGIDRGSRFHGIPRPHRAGGLVWFPTSHPQHVYEVGNQTRKEGGGRRKEERRGRDEKSQEKTR